MKNTFDYDVGLTWIKSNILKHTFLYLCTFATIRIA